MSETEATDPVAPAPEVPPPQPQPRRRSRVVPFFATLLFLALCAAVGYLWQQQMMLTQRLANLPAPANPTAQLTAMTQQIEALHQQVTALQQRPVPALAAADAGTRPDLKPLEARLAALEQRVNQASSGSAPAAAPDLGPMQQKLDSVAAEAVAARGAAADLRGKLADLTERLNSAEQQAKRLGARASDAQRLEQAQVALDAGEPLGAIPDAPPALARFANTKPPTEAALRLAFPQAATAAIRASAPDTAGKSFGERMWLRARGLVTVRQGNKVLLGAPAAEVLGVAQARLDAGDLGGAAKALDALDSPAAAAMAPWRQQAEALLAARAALAKMARS